MDEGKKSLGLIIVVILLIVALTVSVTYIICDKLLFYEEAKEVEKDPNSSNEMINNNPTNDNSSSESVNDNTVIDQSSTCKKDVTYYTSQDGQYTLVLVEHKVKTIVSPKFQGDTEYLFHLEHTTNNSFDMISGTFHLDGNQIKLSCSLSDYNYFQNIVSGTNAIVEQNSSGIAYLNLSYSNDIIMLGNVQLMNEDN